MPAYTTRLCAGLCMQNASASIEGGLHVPRMAKEEARKRLSSQYSPRRRSFTTIDKDADTSHAMSPASSTGKCSVASRGQHKTSHDEMPKLISNSQRTSLKRKAGNIFNDGPLACLTALRLEKLYEAKDGKIRYRNFRKKRKRCQSISCEMCAIGQSTTKRTKNVSKTCRSQRSTLTNEKM